MPSIVRIKEGLTHGRRDHPDNLKVSGDIYVASDDEVMSFSDKFVILDRTQAVKMIQETTIDRILALAENDLQKALFLVELEREGKQRTTLIDRLGKVGKLETE